MNPSGRESWPPPHRQGQPGRDYQQEGRPPPPPSGSGAPGPGQQGPGNGPVLPPPPTQYYASNPQGGHPLPNIASMSQNSPPQNPPNLAGPPQSQSQGPQNQQGPAGQPYSLPSLGPVQHQQQPPPNSERDRMMMRHREMDAERERELQRSRDAQRQAEFELAERERQRKMDVQQQPHQNHAGSIPIHQPVASKVPATIHGPGGLLSGLGGGAGPAPSAVAMGGASAPGFNAHGPSESQSSHNGNRPMMQQQQQGPQQQPQQQQSLPPPPQHHLVQNPNAMNGLPQGQQPILNDALSYLDQVKVQFVDQSEVYNRFLDIMKDFKSQAIDTPGVIERVSNLFAGHPNLIQGFNTFLPPGYRIECGIGDNPNTIRVTTPQGTTNLSMGGMRPGPEAGDPSAIGRNGPYYDQPPPNTNGTWQAQEYSAGNRQYSPDGRSNMPGATQSGPHRFEGPVDQNVANAAAIAHQQEQRGVSQLQNAVSVATNGPGNRMMPDSQMGGVGGPANSSLVNGLAPGMAQGQAGMEKRGPVEFNHAISYVNKIKNRFAQQPEIYKQFLEILQTYQRESKPIQDVYAQVTQLFSSATDLLEDFKQFLPESAAQAKAQAAAKQAAEDGVMYSDLRTEPSYIAGAQVAQVAHQAVPKMPPVGNFAPPPAGADRKKKRPAPGSTPTTGSAFPTIDSASQYPRGTAAQQPPPTKRQKPNHAKPSAPEVPAVEPTLIPALPEPLPPTSSAGSVQEQFAWFDRVKKFIGNKQTFNEFLKLCNLFSQDLISLDDLVAKANNFIGGNPDLFEFFKSWILFRPGNRHTENVPRPGPGRVTLSSCRGYGPSYRLLPKRERFQLCSGRDELCKSVLNDEWASHPTWASEDSGFIAHRKNQFEEQLHRMEEERHDYDWNIQAAERTIQILSPIAGRINSLSEAERRTFQFDPQLGGTSTSIYQRVLKKMYGREIGQNVINHLHSSPCAAVPVVLHRMKGIVEVWKAGQREWNKIWRDTTSKNFYKSLDHMGINIKLNDKKLFQQKQLLAEIHTKRAEQDRQRTFPHTKVTKYQFEFSFDDMDIVFDVTKLLLVHTGVAHNLPDRSKLDAFLREFIPAFFGLATDRFEEENSSASRISPVEDEAEEGATRGRALTNGKRSDLLRGVLDRGSRSTRQGRADNDTSKESTPEAGTTAAAASPPKETNDGATETDEVEAEVKPDNWLKHPETTSASKTKPLARQIPPFEPYTRHVYSFYCNAGAYTFIRLFQILYERLLAIKQCEARVAEEVRRAKWNKPADDLSMVPSYPDNFFGNTSAGANYYRQVLEMCEQVLEGGMDASHFEDALRIYYISCGWKLYTVDKLVSAIVRAASGLVSSEGRDRSSELIQLFFKDRERSTTTHKDEITYRKQVEKLVKDGDGVFRIAFNQSLNKATVEILSKEDNTFDANGMTAEQRWSYYTASYVSRQPTEGVDSVHVQMPFLERNRHGDPDDEDNPRVVPVAHHEGLQLRMCIDTYKIIYDKFSEDWFVHDGEIRSGSKDEVAEARRLHDKRAQAFVQKLIDDNKMIKGASAEEKEKLIADFNAWVGKEPAPATAVTTTDAPTANADQPAASVTDQVMADA